MKTALLLIRRNCKLFFKDKGMFFAAMMTPGILLVLYATFLGNVYRDTFMNNLPADILLPDKLVDGLVGGQLISSILAVCSVTVAFCSNFLMVHDKANGVIKDLRISPAPSWVLALSYYTATLLSTLLISLTAAGLCLGYLALTGWYLTAWDVLLLLSDVALLVFFGTALSSVINFFLSSHGQISAVATIVSAGYGFLCGAYMPISSFGEGLQKVLSFMPGTYGTALVRTHTLSGPLKEMERLGIPVQVTDALRDALDCHIYFFGEQVSLPAMYLVLGGAIALLLGLYVLLNMLKKRPA